MITLTEIRQKLYNQLRKTEELRIEKYSSYKISLIFSIALFFLGIILIIFAYPHFNSNPSIVLGSFLILLSLSIYYFVSFRQKKEYKESFKSTILKDLVENILPGVSYEPKSWINSTEFNASRLYSTNYNIYKGEDYFSGNSYGVNFKMSELTVQRETNDYDDNGTKSSTTTLFKGIFIIMDMPKSTQGETYILPDTAENLFGNFGKFIQKNLVSVFRRGSMVYLEEHPEFEKQYVVYATEKLESMRLLSANMVQSIMEIHERWKIKPSFAFVDSKGYIGIPYHFDFLKVKLNKSIIEGQEDFLQEFVDEIALCINIIEEIAKVSSETK